VLTPTVFAPYARAGDHPFTIQGVYGRREGVLFELYTSPSTLRTALTAHAPPMSVEDTSVLAALPLDLKPPASALSGGEGDGGRAPFQDVFWSVAMLEGVQLLLDVLHTRLTHSALPSHSMAGPSSH
jgi:hypothetical protein